ncbi:MAG: hypothetical protein GY834_13565, partial [Bacteroidetes bacterium]|nr:hypothetical protein [Bacteroidota bacterium]
MNKKVFTITDLKQEQVDDKFYLSGYANNKGIQDSDGDIPTSYNGEPVYELSRMTKNPVCFVDHKNSASNIAGNFVELKENDKGLFFKLLLRALDQIFNDM